MSLLHLNFILSSVLVIHKGKDNNNRSVSEKCQGPTVPHNCREMMKPPAKSASSESDGGPTAQHTHLNDMEIEKLSEDAASKFKLLALAVGMLSICCTT